MFPLLLATTKIGPMGIALIVAMLVAGASLGYVAFRGDEGLKHRRAQALKAAAKLREKGMNLIPNALTDFAVGDLVGLEHRIRDLEDLLSDPKRLEAEFDKVVLYVNATRLRDPQQRLPYLKSLVELANQDSDLKLTLARLSVQPPVNNQVASLPTVAATSPAPAPAAGAPAAQAGLATLVAAA